MSNKEPMSILVADFGEAFITNDSFRDEGAGGTFFYMAPESLDYSISRITEKSDLWSCGVVIYEMIHLRRPFRDRDEILNKTQLDFDDRKVAKELRPLLVE